MSAYRATASGVILHILLMDSYRSRMYAPNMIPLSLLFLAFVPSFNNRYLAPAGIGLVQKTTYLGSRHPMKAIKVINHE
jgi:hypothetical protein